MPEPTDNNNYCIVFKASAFELGCALGCADKLCAQLCTLPPARLCARTLVVVCWVVCCDVHNLKNSPAAQPPCTTSLACALCAARGSAGGRTAVSVRHSLFSGCPFLFHRLNCSIHNSTSLTATGRLPRQCSGPSGCANRATQVLFHGSRGHQSRSYENMRNILKKHTLALRP